MISTDRDTSPARDRTTLRIPPETNLSASQHPEPSSSSRCLHIGIDVGSTTTKSCVIDPATGAALHASYKRHNARQAESVRHALDDIAAELGELMGESELNDTDTNDLIGEGEEL